ncbi:retrovirus-related pol polyprotein from transposon TNT 1-94 [Tanacetum coccineum]
MENLETGHPPHLPLSLLTRSPRHPVAIPSFEGPIPHDSSNGTSSEPILFHISYVAYSGSGNMKTLCITGSLNGLQVTPTDEQEDDTIRLKTYEELSDKQKLQADCDLKATNIVLKGLPPDVYSLFNHHKVAKDIWDRVKLLMQGTALSKQERKCKLYDEFDKFSHVKGETLHQYYLRFAQLITDMNIIQMTMQLVQVNTKFLNSLPPELGKFVTDVKLARDLHTLTSITIILTTPQYQQHFSPPTQHVYSSLPQSDPYGVPHHSQQYPTTYPTNLSHTQPSVTQKAYPPPIIPQQPQAEFPQPDSGLVVPTFLSDDDPIACMNKEMAFLLAVFSPRYPSTNNHLRSSSNPRNQATIQDGRVTVQQVQGRQGQNVVGSGSQGNASGSWGNTSGQVKVIKCYNCQGEGHMARQCTQPKRKRDATWFKEKVLLVQAQAEGKELDEEQLAFLADPGVADDQVAQTITHNVNFQTDDLDSYDPNCDDISSAKAVLMANLSSCDSDVLSEVPYSDTFQNDIMNQSVQELQYSEQAPIVDYPDDEITSDSNIIPYSQYLEETQQEIVQNTNTSAQQNSMIISMFEQMSNHATSWDKANKESKIVNESLTAELERYKERVKILEKKLMLI